MNCNACNIYSLICGNETTVPKASQMMEGIQEKFNEMSDARLYSLNFFSNKKKQLLFSFIQPMGLVISGLVSGSKSF